MKNKSYEALIEDLGIRESSGNYKEENSGCLLYTSDSADE